MMKIRPLLTTFQQWMEAAAEEDNQYCQAMQMIGKPLKTPIPFQKKFAYQQGSSISTDPMAMDIDKMDMVIAAFNTLSVEEKDRLMREGLCFKCGKPGHYTANCQRTSTQSQNQSRASTRSFQCPRKGKGKPHKLMKKDKGRHAYAFVRTLFEDGSHAVEEDDYLEDDDIDETLLHCPQFSPD